MTILKVSDAAVQFVFQAQVTCCNLAAVHVCFLPEHPEDFRDAGRKTLEVLQSQRGTLSFKSWSVFKMAAVVANMEYLQKRFFLVNISYTQHSAAEWGTLQPQMFSSEHN